MSVVGRENVEAFSGNDFGDKLSFTVGSSYIIGKIKFYIGSLIGFARGIYLGIPKNFNIPKKLIMNNFFNAFGK